MLLSIKGIGSQRVDALYKEFKTIEAISSASVNELAVVSGMGTELAHKIKDFLSKRIF